MISENEKITRVDIETTMKTAYIDYAMSVIVSRALPDVRDGLKPVQRRILYAMNDMGMFYNTAYRKSATVVGEVLGQYHPHGDSSVYFAMVRMAQEWNMRYTLVDGQGNFGSIDGDSPAAMRYTECRMEQIANEMLMDIKKDTVDMMPNYTNEREEPTVLPARIPNLLVNGSSGIAVGMATNMPTHNLREVMDGCIAYIDNNDITVEELMQYVKAPDFPGGGTIYGYNGVRNAYTTGRGSVVLRADTTIDVDNKGRNIIVAHTIPYGVNKSEMIKRQAQLVKEGKIVGITDIRDESDKDGIRVVYMLRHDVVPNVILNKLFQLSELQSSFAVNNIALVHGRPMLLNLKDLIQNFVEHREEVVTRRTKFDMAEAEKRAHLLEGFLRAIDIIDEIIQLIRKSKTVEEAKQGLMDTWQFSELQAQAIVEMRLRQLTGMERQKLQDEYDEKLRFIARCKEILGDRKVLFEVIKDELREIREKYGYKVINGKRGFTHKNVKMKSWDATHKWILSSDVINVPHSKYKTSMDERLALKETITKQIKTDNVRMRYNQNVNLDSIYRGELKKKNIEIDNLGYSDLDLTNENLDKYRKYFKPEEYDQEYIDNVLKDKHHEQDEVNVNAPQENKEVVQNNIPIENPGVDEQIVEQETAEDIKLDLDAKNLNDVHETELLKKMIELPHIIEVSANKRAPHMVATYIQELAALIHSFYSECRLIDRDNLDVTASRLALAKAAKIVMKNALGVLGVNAPNKM